MNDLIGISSAMPVVIAVFSSLIIIIPFATIFHEAGHALAMALFTKERITVFLGSYGNRESSIKFSLGRFDIWLRKNPLRWKGGLCVPGTTVMSIRKQIWYVLAGPLATLILFLVSLAIILFARPQGAWAPIAALCCLYTGISFLSNIVPRDKAIGLSKGNLCYNDGTILRNLLDQQNMPTGYDEAVADCEAGRYNEAAARFEMLIEKKKTNENLFRMGVDSWIEGKNYQRAYVLQKKQIARFGKMNSHDRIQKAFLMIKLGDYAGAIGYLKHLLQLYGPEKYSLNNLGYVLTLTNEYASAITCLNKAISIDEQFAFAYCNRGYALLQLNRLDEGKVDTDYSMQLDPENAHSFRNLGVYYLKVRQYQKALESLDKALELDNEIPGLTGCIREAMQALEIQGLKVQPL